jgi:hypothetical protein
VNLPLFPKDLSIKYVVNLTLLSINSEDVIPAKAGIQLTHTGLRAKPGMINEG